MNKLISHKEAAGLIQSGQSIMVGGFGDAGYPFEMIKELNQCELNHLTIMGNDGGCQGDPKGTLYTSGKVDKLIITYCGLNPDVSKNYTEGKLQIEFVPQGTFVERVRCGGHGLGGFLTPTGVGTPVQEGKNILEVKGKKYLLEEPLHANVAIIKGAVADKFGNLMFHLVARNYNPLMAMAADLVIAEVDKVVQIGALDQNTIMLSGIFVDYIVENGEGR